MMLLSTAVAILVAITAGNATTGVAAMAGHPINKDHYEWNESGTIRLKRRYGSSEETGAHASEPLELPSSPAAAAAHAHGCPQVHTIPVEVGKVVGYPRTGLHDPGCRFLNVTLAASEHETEPDRVITKKFLAGLVEEESLLGRCPSIPKIRVIPGKTVATGAPCVIHAAHRECSCDGHSCVRGHGAYTCIPVPVPLPREMGGCVALESHLVDHVHVDCVCGIRKAAPGKDLHFGGSYHHRAHAAAAHHEQQQELSAHEHQQPTHHQHHHNKRSLLVSIPMMLLNKKTKF